MLDELALRRPDYVGGMLVRLADGQEWAVPRPRLYWVPDDTEEGFAKEWDVEGYGALYDAFQAEADGGRRTGRMLGLMKFLLLRNYALDGDQVKSLIRIDFSEEALPESAEMRDALMDLAMGRTPSPRTFPDGSASPSA